MMTIDETGGKYLSTGVNETTMHQMHPYKPEKFAAQNSNADAKNKLLCLGGNKDPKETGKKPVSDNVNLKPSTYEEMYDYVEGVHELDSRHRSDFPVFLKDQDGNLIDPK